MHSIADVMLYHMRYFKKFDKFDKDQPFLGGGWTLREIPHWLSRSLISVRWPISSKIPSIPFTFGWVDDGSTTIGEIEDVDSNAIISSCDNVSLADDLVLKLDDERWCEDFFFFFCCSYLISNDWIKLLIASLTPNLTRDLLSLSWKQYNFFKLLISFESSCKIDKISSHVVSIKWVACLIAWKLNNSARSVPRVSLKNW